MCVVSACTYANMDYNTNRTRDVMMDVRSDVNDVNVEDEVSATANSENDGTRDVPNNAGVSATCCLKIVSLNVCGLMSKMKYPEFREMSVWNDIICLTETKMDDLDSFDFDGFTCFMKNRSIYKRKWGGGGGGDSIASEKSDLKYGEGKWSMYIFKDELRKVYTSFIVL